MKAAGLADCLNISVVTTQAMAPGEHRCCQQQPKHLKHIITLRSEDAHVSNNGGRFTTYIITCLVTSKQHLS